MNILKLILYPLAKRWLAGENLKDAIERTKWLNSKHVASMINFVGDNVKTQDKAEKVKIEYLQILEKIFGLSLNSAVTLKPEQLCIEDKKICTSNLLEITERAYELGIFVWLDMEKSNYVDETIGMYIDVHRKFPNIGIAIQANLKRTESDLTKLLSERAAIRLVKGVYKEQKENAFQSQEEIEKNFFKIMKILFEKARKFAIGTHDEKLINAGLELNKIYQRDFQIQMLKGIREDLLLKLAADGHNVVEYVPYGKEWLAYGLRRLSEKRGNLFLLFHH